MKLVTVVFEVGDDSAFDEFYKSHRNWKQINGAYPRLIVDGDLVTGAIEIIEATSELGPWSTVEELTIASDEAIAYMERVNAFD